MKPTITFLNQKKKKNLFREMFTGNQRYSNANHKYNYHIIHDVWTNVQRMILASQPYSPKYNFNFIQIYNC